MMREKFLFGFVLLFLFFGFSCASLTGCCAVSKDGSYCVVSSADDCVSGESFAPGVLCDSVSFCDIGCCYDDYEGIYEKNALKNFCEADWVNDPNCNLPGAERGCCILSETTRFETEGQCRYHTENFGLSVDDIDWRSGLNEVDCILLAGEQKRGACVLSGGDCKFGTEASCVSYEGEFYADLLCTSSEIETVCEKTKKTSCVDGRYGVYFVDSCGNYANIYDSSRYDDDSYWEKVYSLDEVCSVPNGARNSKSCGNCNLFEGGFCGLAAPDSFSPDMGDYYCRNTNCEFTDSWGKTHLYKTGESWCVYEGPISEGDDVPGSRHFRYVCNKGVVDVEPCADYRNEICIQHDTVKTESAEVTGKVDFSNAYCRKNNAKNCITIGEQSMDACRDEPDCMVRSVMVGGSFSFEMCVPMYPEGFSFEQEYQQQGAGVCDMVTRTCVVPWGGIFCSIPLDNPGCIGAAHYGAMDEVCRALGDCEGRTSIPNWLGVSPVQGDYAEYDSRIEKYMAAAGLTYKDNLGVGSSLFEQSVFSGSFFSQKLAPVEEAPNVNPDDGSKASGVITAIGGLLAALGAILQSTLMSIMGAVMSMMGALMGLLGGPCPPEIHHYECNLWQPPVGATDCAMCHINDDIPCTEYRCKTIAAGCRFINKGTDEELCVAGQDDGHFPVITRFFSSSEIIELDLFRDYPEYLPFVANSSYKKLGENHYRITNLEGGCLDAYSFVPIYFRTQKPSQCKIDLEDKPFEDMKFFVGTSSYKFNHSVFFKMPDPSHGESQGIDINSDMELYIKCVSEFGHEMPEYFLIETCVNEGPDYTPPRIIRSFPKDQSYVSYDSEGFDFRIETIEPATCRWDYEDKSYKDMENSFECNYDVCSSFFKLNDSEESVYYVRCSDQPWLINTTKESERNANAESFVYVFYRPSHKIKIDSIEPAGKIITTSEFTTIELEVESSGGGQEHACSWSFSGYETMIDFLETGSEGIHVQPDLNLNSKDYVVYVECVDETGDLDRKEGSFSIFRKTGSPLISRVWQTGNTINFITSEEAECVYSKDNCFYAFNESEPLSGDGINHRIRTEKKGESYFIKCRDNLGNVPLGCSIILSSS